MKASDNVLGRYKSLTTKLIERLPQPTLLATPVDKKTSQVHVRNTRDIVQHNKAIDQVRALKKHAKAARSPEAKARALAAQSNQTQES